MRRPNVRTNIVVVTEMFDLLRARSRRIIEVAILSLTRGPVSYNDLIKSRRRERRYRDKLMCLSRNVNDGFGGSIFTRDRDWSGPLE